MGSFFGLLGKGIDQQVQKWSNSGLVFGSTFLYLLACALLLPSKKEPQRHFQNLVNLYLKSDAETTTVTPSKEPSKCLAAPQDTTQWIPLRHTYVAFSFQISSVFRPFEP